MKTNLPLVLLLMAALAAHAADLSTIQALLKRDLLSTNLAMEEVQAYTESRVPLVPAAKNVSEWEQIADHLRQDTLERVVFRGEAAAWRKGKVKVVWLETIGGGPIII